MGVSKGEGVYGANVWGRTLPKGKNMLIQIQQNAKSQIPLCCLYWLRIMNPLTIILENTIRIYVDTWLFNTSTSSQSTLKIWLTFRHFHFRISFPKNRFFKCYFSIVVYLNVVFIMPFPYNRFFQMLLFYRRFFNVVFQTSFFNGTFKSSFPFVFFSKRK